MRDMAHSICLVRLSNTDEKKFLKISIFVSDYLNVEKTNQSDNLERYYDFTFTTEKDGKLSTRLSGKHNHFDFHIVNFPFLSGNVPSGLSYDVYISQLIR